MKRVTCITRGLARATAVCFMVSFALSATFRECSWVGRPWRGAGVGGVEAAIYGICKSRGRSRGRAEKCGARCAKTKSLCAKFALHRGMVRGRQLDYHRAGMRIHGIVKLAYEIISKYLIQVEIVPLHKKREKQLGDEKTIAQGH